MAWLQQISFSIINLTPPWFYGFLNFSATLWAKGIGILALIFLIRTIFVFIKTKLAFRKIKKTSFEYLTSLIKEKGINYPKFTVMVPARNEADVVKATIFKLIELNYPKDRFEIIIVTDQKETLQNTDNETTTKEVVMECINILKDRTDTPKIILLDVPYDFDGQFQGQFLQRDVKSTKGRALNYAFTEMYEEFNQNTDFFAFFDTDDHPDANCLIEIAKENILHQDRKVFQMPIFQCRNFWKISTFSKIIALGQSFTHEFFLPWIMTWLPFLGGTNLFISREIMFRVKGFDYHSITEDLDLGVEIYLKTNTWPHFLPYASSEQTPADIKTFLKQRHRWALGQLEVISKLKGMMNEGKDYSKKARSLYYKLNFYGPGEWVVFFLITVLSIFILVSRIFKTIVIVLGMQKYFSTLQISKEILLSIFSFAGLPMILFSLVLLFHYNKYVEYDKSNFKTFKSLIRFIVETSLIIPFLVFLYPLPFFSAFMEYRLGYYKKRELVWVKTPRTKE